MFITFHFLFYLIYKQNNALKEIEENIKENLKGNLYDDKSKLTKKNNLQISIIIPTFIGEVYLKPVICPVLIIIDDGWEDNSDNVIKELTKEDERIISIKNKRNRGT